MRDGFRFGVVMAFLLARLSSSSAEVSIRHQLAERAIAAIDRLDTTPAQWEVRIKLPGNPTTYGVGVLRERDKTRYSGFAVGADAKPISLFKVVSLSNIWYVVDFETSVKCRPWEHFFHSAISEVLLEAAELRFVTDASILSNATIDTTNTTSIQFRERVGKPTAKLLAAAITEGEVASAESGNDQKKAFALTKHFIWTVASDGMAFSVNSAAGFIDRWENSQYKTEISNFNWLPANATNRIRVAAEADWPDRTDSFRMVDWNRCVLVAHDPYGQGGENPRVSPRLGILRLDSGAITRVPIPCLSTLWGCFLDDRQTALVMHQDLVGTMGLSVINFKTAEATPMAVALEGQLIGMPVLSPDKKSVALLHRPNPADSVLDFQMLVIDLKAQNAKPLGKPGRLGGPYSWLPDGSGIVLKRFLPAKDNEIEPRMICVLRRDGTLTDLMPGDDPMIISHLKSILFEGLNREWFVCDFAGKRAAKYVDGMKTWGSPALSPDGKEMLWVQYSKGQLPQINLFKFGEEKGRAVTKSAGFIGHPVW